MPRRKIPKRQIEVLLNEEAVRDALALWVRKYHGIEIQTKEISIVADSEGRITAKFEKEPEKCENAKTTPSSSALPAVTSKQIEKSPVAHPKPSA